MPARGRPRRRRDPADRAFAEQARAAGRRPEQAFQDQVVELAQACGWLVYHTFDSRHSVKGFPDLVMLRDAVLLVVELKVLEQTTEHQELWLERFRTFGATLADVRDSCRASLEVDGGSLGRVQRHGWPRVAVAVWRPSDWPIVEQTLTARRGV